MNGVYIRGVEGRGDVALAHAERGVHPRLRDAFASHLVNHRTSCEFATEFYFPALQTPTNSAGVCADVQTALYSRNPYRPELKADRFVERWRESVAFVAC